MRSGFFFHPLGEPMGGPFLTRPQIAWFGTRWAFYSATSPWMGEKFWFSRQVAYRSPSVCRLRKRKISATPRPKPRPDRVIFWAPPIFHEDGEKCTFENAQISILTYVVGTRSLGARLLVTFSLSAIKPFRLVSKPLEILPEKFWPKNKKWPKFYIFLSEKNFQDPFFSEKTDLAFPTSKAVPRNGARKKNCL